MYEVLFYAVYALGVFTTFLIYQFMLPPRWTKRSQWIAIAALVVIYTWIGYYRFQSDYGSTLNLLTQILSFIGMGFFIAVMCKDKVWRKIAAFCIITVIALIGDVICMAIFRAQYGQLPERGLQSQSPEVIFLHFSGAVVVLMLGFVVVAVWNSFVRHIAWNKSYFAFLIYPISQLMMISYLDMDATIFMEKGTILTLGFWFSGLLLSIVADFFWIYYMVQQSKNIKTRERLKEMQYLQEKASVYYQAMEKKNTETAKIRHDFSNQISAVRHLLQNTQIEDANQMLDEMAEELERTSLPGYCANSIVNAVINDKRRVCEEEKIGLRLELELGELPQIKKMDLCSVFSNLLDNAIDAAVASEERAPYIHVKAKVRGSYLMIEVKNSAKQPSGEKREGRGYGTQIMQDIANKYEGDYLSEWKDGIYTATVALVCEK